MNSPANSLPPLTADNLDPVFRHSRREALAIFLVWLAAALWSLPYCYLNGYGEAIDPQNLETIMGIPSWVFYGVVAPWLVADVLTIILCFGYIKNDDLGESAAEGHPIETGAVEGQE